MCNNFALIAKAPELKTDKKIQRQYNSLLFESYAHQAKIALMMGRENGKRGTGIMHNGRRVRSHDYITRHGKSSLPSNHDSLEFIESLWFNEHASNSSFKAAKGYHVMMGHNRSPSTGMGTGASFVHPFEYFEKKKVKTKEGKEITLKENRMWFQHNGTIRNPVALAAKYNLKFSEYKNDSYLLGSLIYMGVDPAQLFTEYEGACTCIWYWEKTKSLHVFKGGVKNHMGVLEEERPLYMYQGENEIIFNSIEHILTVLTDFNADNNEITDVPINQIMNIDEDLNIEYVTVERKKIVTPPKKSLFTPSPTATVKTQQPLFPDDRDAYNQMIWYKGHYYFSHYKAHGCYKLNNNGELDSKGEEYYFWNGIMLKNVYRFFDVLSGKDLDTNWMHDKALHEADNDLWYNGKGRAENNRVNPILFYDYSFNIYKGVIKKADVSNVNNTFRKNIMPPVDRAEWLRNFNTYYGTEFKVFADARDYYTKSNGLGSLYGTTPRNWNIDFTQICTDVREIVEDPMCDLYNFLNDTKLLTRFQCQQDYFKKNNITNVYSKDVKAFYDALDEYIAKLDPQEFEKNYV